MSCSKGEDFSVELDRCSCEAGKFEYFDEDNNLVCNKCPEGSICEKPGISLEKLPIEPMKWRSSPNSSFLEDCPFDEACVGNLGTKLNPFALMVTKVHSVLFARARTPPKDQVNLPSARNVIATRLSLLSFTVSVLLY